MTLDVPALTADALLAEARECADGLLASWADRLADEIGLDDAELARVQSRVKFNCISSYIRYGHKAQAARMLWENSSNASPSTVGDLVFRLMVPGPLMRWRRNVVKRRMMAVYGTLK